MFRSLFTGLLILTLINGRLRRDLHQLTQNVAAQLT